MQTPTFAKRKYTFFAAFAVFAVVLAVAAAVGTHYYFGKKTPDGVADERLGALTLGRAVEVSALADSCDYPYEWVRSPFVRVSVVTDEGGETAGLLAYDADRRTLTTVGVGKGVLVFRGLFDDTLVWRVPFETKFRSEDTADILRENYPDMFDDEIVTESELQRVTRVRLDNATRVDFADISALTGLERLELRNSADPNAETAVDAVNFSLRDGAHIYVPFGQYLSYMHASVWRDYAEEIYPIPGEDDEITVMLHAEEGQFEDGSAVRSVPATAGEKTPLGDFEPTRRGYLFSHWQTADGAETDADTVYYTNCKLYAVYRPVRYTLCLHDTVDPSVTQTRELVYGAETTVGGEVFGHDDYLFLGWSDTEKANEATFAAGTPLGDLCETEGGTADLYAVWAYKQFTVEFIVKDKVVATRTCVDGEALAPLSETPAGDGEFTGWARTQGAQRAEFEGNGEIRGLRASLSTGGTLSLYALFDPDLYTVIYEAPEADRVLAPAPQEHCKRGEPLVFGAAPVRTGYRFAGWLAPDGSLYDELDEAPHGLATAYTPITLRVQWTPIAYRIHFEANGGDSIFGDVMATYDSGVTFSGTASRTGHTYQGVESRTSDRVRGYKSLSKDLVNRLYAAVRKDTLDNDFPMNMTVYMYAAWSRNSYVLTVKNDHATVTITDDYGKKYTDGAHVPYDTKLYYTCSANSGYENPKLTGHGGASNAKGSFYMPAQDLTVTATASQSCIAAGTRIRMADGSVRPIEQVHIGDAVLGWDLRTGKLAPTTLAICTYHGDGVYPVLTLSFGGGREVRIIDQHVFYDKTQGRFVTITVENYADCIGDVFACADPGSGDIVYETLMSGSVREEYTGAYSPITAAHYTCVTEDVVTAAPDICGIYELLSDWLGEDGMIDEVLARADIEKYGVYTYEEFADYMSRELFEALAAPYYRVAVGKGYATPEEIADMLTRYAEWL